LINTPIALYYMQGLNLTPLHGHTALFGVYGMLGIGLMLFCLRGLRPEYVWHQGWLRGSFWCFNIGLALMALLTLLPMGVLQLPAALEHASWYARWGGNPKPGRNPATGVGGGPSSPTSRCSTCWCGCACRATWCSPPARCCSRGSRFGSGACPSSRAAPRQT